MRWLAEARERLGALLFRSRRDAEMDEELRFHLEMETEKNLRAGMSLAEARRRAAMDFGGMGRVRDEVREARGLGWLEVGARDARYALRGLRSHPAFSVTLVLTLALGIGATSAVFSIVDALLLRPLPYHDPGRLVQVQTHLPGGGTMPYLGWDAARAWREQPGLFRSSMAHARRPVHFTGAAEPRMLMAEGVTPDFEEVLGVRPALGRGLFDEDAEPGAPPVAVLDHAFWSAAFGASPGVIGREIEIDGRPHRVVGVMPEGFKFPEYATTELWVPIRDDGMLLGAPAMLIGLLGRIGGEPLQVVQERADAAARSLAERQPREQGWAVRLQPLQESRANDPVLRRSVWFLAGAVALLLLVAAVNATCLLLVRGWSRSRELAVRAALGASRRRLVGQMLTESMVLALLGGVAASLFALLALRALRGIMPDSITFFAPYAIEVEGRTLAFTFAVAAATGVATGMLPALRALRRGSVANRAGLTPYAAVSPEKSRLRRALIVGEVALSVMLLIGAGLLMHSFVRLVGADPGFRTEDLAVLTVRVPDAGYPTPEARAELLRRLEQRIEALPGVEGVAVNGGVPPAGGFHVGVSLEVEGAPPPAGQQPNRLPFASVPPDFFDVLEVPVVAGRAFTLRDVGTDHVIIDRGLARLLWGEASPLGRRLRTGPDAPWLTVVGVVGDLRMMGADDREGRFELLYPWDPSAIGSTVPLAIRTRGDPRPLLPSFRATVRELDPRLPVQELRPARELYAASVEMPRFLLVLVCILSGLGLTLAAVGIYGVLAFGVAQRRRELGIRIALGAPLPRVARQILREGLLLALMGTVAGIVAALALSGLVQSLLYGVEPTDPATISMVAVVSLGAAALACYWPARRAMRIDPVDALRAE